MGENKMSVFLKYGIVLICIIMCFGCTTGKVGKSNKVFSEIPDKYMTADLKNMCRRFKTTRALESDNKDYKLQLLGSLSGMHRKAYEDGVCFNKKAIIKLIGKPDAESETFGDLYIIRDKNGKKTKNFLIPRYENGIYASTGQGYSTSHRPLDEMWNAERIDTPKEAELYPCDSHSPSTNSPPINNSK